MSGFSATRASRSSLSPCCWRASANVFASAQVSRKVPPLEAIRVIIPAVGGPSRTSSHSCSVKSALLVIASPFARRLGVSTQSSSSGENLHLWRRPADEAVDEEEVFCLRRRQRLLGRLRRSARRRCCARRERAHLAHPAAGNDERLLPARLDRRGEQADLQAPQALDAAQALLNLLERLDPVAQPRGLGGRALALAAEVRPQPGAEVARAADIEHLPVAVAEEVDARPRRCAVGERALAVDATLARRRERPEIREVRGPELLRKAD